MTLSRTARILIALLLVAAAAFFWVNFFNQPDSVAPLAQPTTIPGAAAADATTTAPTVNALSGGAAAEGAPLEGEAPAAAADAAAQGGLPSAAAPAVVTPPTVVLRDLVVDDLPFLVTTPPAPEAATEGEAATEAGRAVAGLRGNINPFSPVIVQAPPAEPAPVLAAAEPSSEPDVVIVNSNGQPTAAGSTTAGAAGTSASAVGTPVQAPAPRAVAPAPTRATDLPRPLPGGTLPVTPDILRDARTVASTPSGPQSLAEVAAVKVPETSAASALPAVQPQTAVTSPAGLGVLGPGQPTAESVKASGSSGLPLVVGADQLSRYLRDNDVRFTGTALGPLSVGVFRAKQFDQPMVLTLGQTLPDTEIVLADLRGYEAKFSLGDNTQVLSLDIRR